ncbi:4-aminobutyrate--2-oxoglutarate transaminase [Deinococcus soli (ex Cha et al. 2016)]|uniref:4-aminobutyrate aminotransferase/(S)-3-amino-2-methylpropionate transaminase n=2 Tax=Deinococcus soli (ex Cha et al. 2016) TaxID=1309411 RepID=A0ACC6KEY9_9DEIO|nr:4-aminobutyrate--2-oxoglutarate transaminase [Deinococcus soli (ex Cha et al. 2016)]MDR6218027.1 4-aminobutyrate aminotransferase/(S)-3-amino-2-methylpropionate transaminase [Deinococcus soli (ex Cha et al. 2016)]MDR6328277.1 4-aminobutyrate aminotransferase/(S)-3-amino-2-methylpropionate transaminase [Deinococcus soli (ex Cha et al. 2016)]MDR6751129.1 4-aminobutyrate aminotransferase/(S)-3-amino-2-methylpropionate transaminase [Deinococcus soli (ex Cha et al. 2016)]
MTVTSHTEDLLALRHSEIPRGVSLAHPVIAARAEGVKVWDVEGREYHDWVGGIGVLNVGHNHPAVVAAVQAQLANFSHTCFQVTAYEGYLRLAQRLNARFPGGVNAKTLFLTTGAEATENAIKIARAYTNRPAVISFTHSFHGRTLMGMTLTGKKAYYAQNFGPFAPDVYHAPFPYEYRGTSVQAAVVGLHELFRTTVDPSRVAAIILEPVLGEGGFLPAPAEFLRALRQVCDEHGIVFIADEIQSGVGRTGDFWAIEASGVQPDLLTFAKSIGGGLPISGVTGRAEIMDAPTVGGLGGTYAGNPLACAAGLAVLDLFEDSTLLEHARQVGERLRAGFEALAQDCPRIGDVRGQGPMIALEFVRDRDTREPDPETATRVVEEARARGLLLLKAGMYASVIRVLVPLTVTEEELDEGLARLRAAVLAATA